MYFYGWKCLVIHEKFSVLRLIALQARKLAASKVIKKHHIRLPSKSRLRSRLLPMRKRSSANSYRTRSTTDLFMLPTGFPLCSWHLYLMGSIRTECGNGCCCKQQKVEGTKADLMTKVEILRPVTEELSWQEVMWKYGIKWTMLGTYIKNKAQILPAYRAEGFHRKRKRRCTTAHLEVEGTLLKRITHSCGA